MLIQTNHFKLSFGEEDASYAEKTATRIEDIYSRIITTFRIPDAAESYCFILCRDVPEYLRETGKTMDNYESWMVGWADYVRKKLCILSPRVVLDRTESEMDKVIVHETETFEKDALAAFFREKTQRGAFFK